jgi:glycosyltransferase involved in cell wall biosynthesis
MSLLFFDLEITGHHVEYLYHVINYRIKHSEQPPYFLVTHPEVNQRLEWLNVPCDLESMGVHLLHPTRHEMERISESRTVNQRADLEFGILKRFVLQYHVKKCILLSINKFQFVIGKKANRFIPCNVRGILFNPLGHAGAKFPAWAIKLRKNLQAKWMLRNRYLDHIYILNDADLPNALNNRYRCNDLFVHLPDPIFIPPSGNGGGENSPFLKTSTKKRFLLFGTLSSRKGIFLVLDALNRLPEKLDGQVEIVFAGNVIRKERDAFENAISDLKSFRPKIDIVHIDGFLPYNKIPDLFLNSSYVLVPYNTTNSSSGIIGHAALYGKPVIGQSGGLIGRLIRDYNLGIAVSDMEASKLASVFVRCLENALTKTEVDASGMKRFVQERHPERFVELLVEG